MAQLAIRGHTTHSKEVIEILEMLGGENKQEVAAIRENYVYFIDKDTISFLKINQLIPEQFVVFTLEEFEEKFPYKVGDRVIYEDKRRGITKMVWEGQTNTVAYKLDDKLYCNVINKLQPYKKETMEEQKKDYDEWFQIDYLDFENNDDTWADEVEINLGKDYEIQIREDKTFIVKKKSQYPKTYEECIGQLPINWDGKVEGYKSELLLAFQKLLIARDVYWKIYGEQMGLGKSWKPSKNDTVYCIFRFKGEIVKDNFVFGDSLILEFPTEEMRDAFFENFKDLIEQCKELL